jgi:thioredoxin 1
MLLEEFNFKREVLDSTEPVLVDFWAPWCGPCRMMQPAIDSLARDFKVAKVNIDSNPKLAQRFGVTSIPALYVFQGGRVVSQHLGVTPESKLREEMQRLSTAKV